MQTPVVNIPESLKPKATLPAKPPTVGQQKIIKQYGSIKAYEDKKKVDAEIKNLGIDNITSAKDYEEKYKRASELTKKYLQTPAQVAAAIKEQTDKLIQDNRVKIQEKINYYQEKIRDKRDALERKKESSSWDRYDSERRQRYKDRYDEYEEYYEGIIKGLKKGIGKPSDFGDILAYAKDVGRYERNKERARNENKKYEREFNQKVEDLKAQGYDLQTLSGYDTSSGKDKYTGGKLAAYNPKTGDWKTLKSWTAKDVGGKKPSGIKVGDVTYSTGVKKAPETTQEKKEITVPVNTQMIPIDASKIKVPQQGFQVNQGTKIEEPVTFTMPTRAEQFISREKIKDRIVELGAMGDWEEGKSYTYDYGQGTPQAKQIEVPVDSLFTLDGGTNETKRQAEPLTFGPAPSAQPTVWGSPQPYVTSIEEKEASLIVAPKPSTSTNPAKLEYTTTGIVETPTLTFVGDKRDAEIKKLEDQLSFSVDPGQLTISEVKELGDNRGTFGTIFKIGDEPTLSGSEVTYATGKILEDTLQEDFNKNLQPLLEEKKEKLLSNIKVEQYQKRVNSGEDIDKVQAEIDKEYAIINKELQDFAKEYKAKYEKERGVRLRKTAEQVYFDTALYGKAKDTEAKVAGLFGKGAAVGAVGAVAVTGASVVAPVVAPVAGAVGIGAGILFGGMALEKARDEGREVYEQSLELGFTEREAQYRGLLAGATDIAPFAFTAAGATAGGLIVGGGLQKARKPVRNVKEIDPGVKELTSRDVISVERTATIGGKQIKYNELVFQKTSQIPVKGARVETTTAWRNFLNTRFNTNIKPISTGAPADTSGARAAIRLYRQYGLTESQAQQAIRYTPPTVYDQVINTGYNVVRGNVVGGRVTSQVTTRNIVVDKSMGIRTRMEVPKYQQTTFGREPYLGTRAFGEISRTITLQGGVLDLGQPIIKTGFITDTSRGSLSTKYFDANVVRSESASWTKELGGPVGIRSDRGSLVIRDLQLAADTKGVTYIGGEKTPWTKTFPVPDTSSLSQSGMAPPPQGGQSLVGVTKAVPATQTALLKIAPPVPEVKIIQTTTTAAPITGTIGSQILAPLSLVSGREAVRVEEDQDESLFSGFLYGSGDITSDRIDSRVDVDVQQDMIQGITQIQSPSQVTSPITSNPIVDISPTPPPVVDTPEPPFIDTPEPRVPIGIKLPWNWLKESEKKPKQVAPYYAEAKVKGKFVRVTDKPYTKSGARDVLARVLDNTTAAQGRIVRQKKKKKGQGKPLKGDDYYLRNKDKFRDFKIVQGQRVNVKNALIEKRGFRSDTPGEKQGLGIAQVKSTGKKGRPRKQRRTPFGF